MADRAVFDEDHWAHYTLVNNIVAEATLEALRTALARKPSDVPVIWIHDYHLMEVANIVRRVASQDKLNCKIGYFMHIPFPPWDMIRIHPWKDIFLQGMLGSDLVGVAASHGQVVAPGDGAQLDAALRRPEGDLSVQRGHR